MSDEDEELTQAEAFEWLSGESGRTFWLPTKADEILAPFTDEATATFLEEHDSVDYPSLVFQKAIKEEQHFPDESGGITSVPEYQPVISTHEISGVLVEALGGEPSSGLSIGRGRAADEAHRAHMEFLGDHLDVDPPETEAE